MSAVPWWVWVLAVPTFLVAQHLRTVARRNRRAAETERGEVRR